MSMCKRGAFVSLAVTLLTVFALPVGAASAAEPWWQVLTSSRPTNLWQATDNEQEIKTELTEFFGEQAMAANLRIKGQSVGCLGTSNPAGAAVCGGLFGFPPTTTAAELETLLESAYGTPDVEVTGGPVGGGPFKISVPDRYAPQVELSSGGFQVGKFQTKVLSQGGSGRLVVTLTNLGSAPVDATTTPVTIVDELPDEAEATGVEAFAGTQGKAGPVSCEISPDGGKVTCAFEGELPSYDAIEVEILVSLLGEPPVAGSPGKVTISGGNAAEASAVQSLRVSPEEAPAGFEVFAAGSEEEGGGQSKRAGGHPFQLTTTLQLSGGRLIPLPFNQSPLSPPARDFVWEQPGLPRNFRFTLPNGLVGNAARAPICPMETFFNIANLINSCPDQSAIGVMSATIIERANLGLVRLAAPIFNLPPARGEPARFGFVAGGVPVVIDTAVDSDDQYRIIAKVDNVTQIAQFLSSTVVIWGAPGDPAHDTSRGWNCVYTVIDLGPCERPSGLEDRAFLRQPVSCVTPVDFDAEMEPWNVPLGSKIDRAGFSGEKMEFCNQVPFNPAIKAVPTTTEATGSSGLGFRLSMPDPWPEDKGATAEGQAKKVQVILPEGVTINPSQAEGLGSCSPADYARETAASPPGAGCPESSKVGTVDIATPLLDEKAEGAVYVARPFDNPFGSLIALYMVAKIPERGILVKQAGKVELNPTTGRIVTTFDDLPQLPFSTFNLNFFAGGRAPLVTPSQCSPAGEPYEVVARFTPWHASDPNNPLPDEIVTKTSTFTIDRGPNGRPCPSGMPPFAPEFTAGTQNSAAGTYSPFLAQLTRQDGEQEFSRFSMKLPKGVIGKLAGVQFCPEAAIAAARARTGPNGGLEEQQSPSCPAASEIGRTLVGAGVGPGLSYAPGKIYLAGPFQGSKLSIVAITTAKVGPFDLGNVVIRQALKVDPETAQVSTDGAASDPIPHILRGIVVHARDIRVFVDRENFILNPTSCKRMSAGAAVFGSGLDFASPADDQVADVSSPFQAAECASLGFKPKLSLQLLGATKRTGTPRLKAVVTARKGDANIGRAQVTLPRSAFLEQAHIRTVCTRVQFRAGGGNGEKCPKGSIYGRARATSPLLDETLKGPVFLRSSDNELPDLVAALRSPKVNINLVGRIDSLDGRIRNTFETVPDAPVKKFVLEMQGGDKGLIVNSTNICRGKHRAIANFKGQNGHRYLFNPLVKAKCKGKAAKKGEGRR